MTSISAADTAIPAQTHEKHLLRHSQSVTFAACSPTIDRATSSSDRSPDKSIPSHQEEVHPVVSSVGEKAAAAGVGAQISEETPMDDEPPKPPSKWRRNFVVKFLQGQIAWIPPNIKSWDKLKPVFRSAIAAWICMVIIMINPALRTMGSASFLVLISSALQPADAPVVSILERELALLLLCLIAWGYSCIPIAIAYGVRKQKIPAQDIANPADIFRGDFIEASPSIVCAIFQAFGAAIYLWIKASFGPGPLLFGSVLSCVLLNISLTEAPMFPYPVYTLGKSLMIPLSVKAAVTIIVGCLFYPKSNNSLFCNRIQSIFGPLKGALDVQVDMLKRSPLEEGFPFDAVQGQIAKAEANIPLLQMSSRLLKREIVVGHASGTDLKEFEILVRKTFPAFDAMSSYYTTVKADVLHAAQSQVPTPFTPHTPAPTLPPTPAPSRTSLTEPRPSADLASHRDHDTVPDDIEAQSSSRPGSAVVSPRISRSSLQREDLDSHHAHFNDLLHLVLHPHSSRHDHHSSTPSRPRSHRRRSHLSRASSPAASHRHKLGEAPPVGTWESLKYAAVEAHLHPESSNKHTELCMSKLNESVSELLMCNSEALQYLSEFFALLNKYRVQDFIHRFTNPREPLKRLNEREQEATELVDRFEKKLNEFREEKRLILLEPLINSSGNFDPSMPHRYIYQAFMHQFALLDLSKQMLRLLQKTQLICKERKVARIWGPDLAYWKQFEAWIEVGTDNDPEEHERNAHEAAPNRPTNYQFFPEQAVRDPDALEPETKLELLGQDLWSAFMWCFSSTRLFVWKAGIATALVSLPQYMQSSASFCYQNKAVWSIFMMQLSMSRHRGDSLFAIWVRIIATAVGACLGGAVWYIASGTSKGNVWGMGVTTAFAFPLLYFFRTYHPSPPPLRIVLLVTLFMVLGYSWIDTHQPAPFTRLSYGSDIMVRRMINVFIGLGAAFIVSWLPPSQTLRAYQRQGHAASIETLTRLTSSVLTFGTVHPDPSAVPDTPGSDRVLLTKALIGLRGRIRRLKMIGANTAYEATLRGRWPAERYAELNLALLEATKTLTYAFSVLKTQQGPWARALFRRLRLSDPQFLASLFAVMHMSQGALAGGKPLPQITPAPLFDRIFTFKHNGFDVISTGDLEDDEEDEFFALPHLLDKDTLVNIDYFRYASGATAWSAFILRLDRVALAVKQLCGEAYMVPTRYKDYTSLFDRLEQVRQAQARVEKAERELAEKKKNQ